mmetsp:Transcript_12945/g.32753  ORF Transcript_12945/g.32753 Transcript_12945/m.32753 type:complete len:140 (+) Transcript_12945:322-741(+)
MSSKGETSALRGALLGWRGLVARAGETRRRLAAFCWRGALRRLRRLFGAWRELRQAAAVARLLATQVGRPPRRDALPADLRPGHSCHPMVSSVLFNDKHIAAASACACYALSPTCLVLFTLIHDEVPLALPRRSPLCSY